MHKKKNLTMRRLLKGSSCHYKVTLARPKFRHSHTVSGTMIDEVESDNSINGRDEADRNIDQLVQLFEQYDRSALADILLANDGNMEETISLLLSQSTAQNNNSQVGKWLVSEIIHCCRLPCSRRT